MQSTKSSETWNFCQEGGTCITLDDQLSSSITAIYSELKKIRERIGPISVGRQSPAWSQAEVLVQIIQFIGLQVQRFEELAGKHPGRCLKCGWSMRSDGTSCREEADGQLSMPL